MPGLRTAAVRDGHLAYTDTAAETGPGEPVVLLHGGALDHGMWSRQVDAFAGTYRVVAPDARGHGDSSTPAGPFRHCDDLAALLRGLGTGPVTLIGVSMGAGTAVDTALEHPDLVRALIVSGTGSSDPDWRDPWMLQWLAASARQARQRDAEGWITTFLQLAAGPHRTLADVDPQVVAELREQAGKVLTAHLRDSEPVLPSPVPDVRRRAREITVPVLALPGALDSVDHIRMASELAERVACGKMHTIDGAAHYPNMERPEQFNRLVLEFLGDVRRPTDRDGASWVHLRLDLDRFDADSVRDAVNRCREDGVRLSTYAALGDTPENRRRLYELNRLCSADIPGRGPFYTYDEYVTERIDVASFDPDGVIIATDGGGRWVGMTALSNRGDHAFVEMTGVVRDHRGRGLSLALKARALDHVRTRGIYWIRTMHHASNLIAISANRRLGFVTDNTADLEG